MQEEHAVKVGPAGRHLLLQIVCVLAPERDAQISPLGQTGAWILFQLEVHLAPEVLHVRATKVVLVARIVDGLVALDNVNQLEDLLRQPAGSTAAGIWIAGHELAAPEVGRHHGRAVVAPRQPVQRIGFQTAFPALAMIFAKYFYCFS